MKKKLFVFFSIVFFLVGCSANLSTEDVSKVSKGMSQEKVIDLLGNPTERTTDRKELETTYSNYSTLYITAFEFDDDEDNDYEGYSEYGDTYDAIQEKRNVEAFKYDTSVKDAFIIVYFLDNEVSFFYTLNLNEI